MSEEMVTISKEEHVRLLKNDQLLCALEAVGVDGWEGYSAAMDYLQENHLE